MPFPMPSTLPLFALAAALLASGCAHQLAITDVTVVDPRSGSVEPHRTVTIAGDRIVTVGDASRALPLGTRRIDGSGKFLIPGLWDAHTHLSKVGEAGLGLYLANGVTGVRDMGSNSAELRAWQAAIAAGTLAGPQIRMSGPMLESAANIARMRKEAGVEDVERQRIGIDGPDAARAAVRQLAAEGVDQIKVRTSPNAETFAATVDEARKLGLPTAAHPRAQGEMLATALPSIEHFLGYPPSDPAHPARAELFARLARARMHVDNTMVVYRGGVVTPYETGKAVLAPTGAAIDVRRGYLCGYILADWGEQLEEMKDGSFGAIADKLPGWNREFRDLHVAGVPLLAGSDAGVAFVYPGFSMHDQLAVMVEDVGLTPMETLRIATAGVPDYFGDNAEAGGIAPGQRADLVLLAADPTRDIAATRRILAVVAGGRLHTRADLDALLAGIAADAAGPCTLGSKAGRTLR